MTNVLLDGFSNYWHRRKSSMKNHTRGETTSVARLSATPQRPEPLERNRRTIPLNFKGLKINKNSAEGEVFLVDFPSYRTLRAVQSLALARGEKRGVADYFLMAGWLG